MVSSYKTMGNNSSNSDTIIILLFMMISAFISSFISVVAYLSTRPKEGDVCAGEDENAEYKINEKGKCQFEECKSGYITYNHKCMKPLFDAPEEFGEPEVENPDPATDNIYDQLGESEDYEAEPYPPYPFGNTTVPKNSVGVLESGGEGPAIVLEPGKLIRSRNEKFGIHNDSSTGEIKLHIFDKGEFKVLLQWDESNKVPGTTKETTSLKIDDNGRLSYGNQSDGQYRDAGQVVRLYLTELDDGHVTVSIHGKQDGIVEVLYKFI